MTYAPGMLIWHSRDLVNWEPVCNAIEEYTGSVWAPDFIRHKDIFYIYYFASGKNFVLTAPSPEGPWSKSLELNIGNTLIDPGHVVGPDGKRYLHLSHGYIVELTEDGLSVAGKPRCVYEGWQYPEDWYVEGFCLESPKLTVKDGYYYLTVAEGGTSGPATSHMVVSSRSRTPWGPWEHSPYNPVVHTASRKERWWSRGHGTLVDTPNGDWWILYHGYEKGYQNLGRQTLLEPIEWTDDGWFKIPEGIQVDKPIKKPCGEIVPHGLQISDDFSSNCLGLQWRSFGEYEPERYITGNNKLIIKAKNTSPADCAPLTCITGDHAYEISVQITVPDGAEGGLLLFYNPVCYCGIGTTENVIFPMRRKKKMGSIPYNGNSIHLRIINDHHDIVFFHSTDGRKWSKFGKVIETSAYQHNAFGSFISLRIGLYAAGAGEVTFRNFMYRALD